MDFLARWERLKDLLSEEKIDYLIITNPSNIFYLLGERIEGILIFSTEGKFYFLSDPRYKYELENIACKQLKIIITKKDFAEIISNLINSHFSSKIGAVEKNYINLSLFERLKENLRRKKIIGKDNLVERLRAIKDDYEIELIRKAITIVKKSVKKIERCLKKGVSEKELSDLLEMELRKNGADKSSFDIIVAASQNSAYPHAFPRRNRIIDYYNDFLLLDLGANLRGYNCDLTYMLFFVKIPNKIKKLYHLVNEAHEIAKKIIKPGIRVSVVHKKIKEFFKKRGVDKYFLHNSGHGIGIDVHEIPFIGEKSKEIFKENMIITIEPGIYLKGLGGVRVERMYRLTSNGIIDMSLQ